MGGALFSALSAAVAQLVTMALTLIGLLSAAGCAVFVLFRVLGKQGIILDAIEDHKRDVLLSRDEQQMKKEARERRVEKWREERESAGRKWDRSFNDDDGRAGW